MKITRIALPADPGSDEELDEFARALGAGSAQDIRDEFDR